MPIIGKVGRKTFKVRTLNFSIHTILILGAITMIYPFLIMLSASFNSPVDAKQFSLFPKFFYDDEMLYKKYIEARMNEESTLFQDQYKKKFLAFEFLKFPNNPQKIFYDDWMEFLSQNEKNYNYFDYYVSEQYGRGIYPKNERKFRNLMKKECQKSIDNFNKKYATSVLFWEEVRMEERYILNRNFGGELSPFRKRYAKFRSSLPTYEKNFASLDGHFITNEIVQSLGEDLEKINIKLGTDFKKWDDIILSEYLPEDRLQPYWVDYVKHILNVQHIGILESAKPELHKFLKDKYETIELLNKTWGTQYVDFESIPTFMDIPEYGAINIDLSFFIESIANPKDLKIKSVEIDFRKWLKEKYSANIKKFNSNYNTGFKSFEDLSLPNSLPEHNLALRKDWLEFVKNPQNLNSIYLSMSAQSDFISFLKNKFSNELKISEINNVLGTNFDKVMNIYPSKYLPKEEKYKKLWIEFVLSNVNEKFIHINKEKNSAWIDFLKKKYNDVNQLNKKYNLSYSSFDQISVDFHTIDYFIFKEHQKDIFKEFVKRNYVMVLDVMLFNGRAIINTLIYVILAVLTAIFVNPLAAYAMSRFKLKSTYKIILLLMLTMAFPPMVMGIPNFLLLKKMNLLNTFWALILPAAADGYFIFLLKGFFDSLPQQLFESATIDGAGEFRIFWQIAMQLSKPIMAVIALGAFNGAYRNFMFAFIVCQDQSMWTMMVHIYQLIQRSADGVGYAALVIASIPTFAAFVFFQNIIIKGIVVPQEK